jgi:Zn-dependent protease with chaperone function
MGITASFMVISALTNFVLGVFWFSAAVELLLPYVFWKNEFKADEFSATVNGVKGIRAVLEFLKAEKDSDSLSHPSPSRRIERLKFEER